MEWKKTWMFDKQTILHKDVGLVYEGNAYECFRHCLIELYLNWKKWGIKCHIEYDGDTVMEGWEVNFQFMLGPLHFLISWERYVDKDGIFLKSNTKIIKKRRQNAEHKLN